MASTDLEQLVLQLNANFSRFEKQLNKAQGVANKSAGRIEQRFKSMNKNVAGFFDLGNLAKSFAVGAIGGLGIEQLGRAIGSIVSEAAGMADLADKVGISTDEIQKLTYGAVQANLTFEDLSGSLSKFSKTLGEAQNGQGELLKLFQANGFSQAAVQALSLSDALRVVADLTQNARNEQDQMVIATTAFGKAGGDMIEFLRNGSEGLRQFGNEAQTAGAVIEESLFRKAQGWDDTWAALMRSMKASLQDFTLTSLMEMEKLGEAFASLGVTSPTGRMVGRFAVPNSMLKGIVAPPPVKGAGSVGFSFTPKVSLGNPAGQTVIPQEEEKARSSIRSTNDVLRKRLSLIRDIENTLAEAEKKQAEDKAFSWAANYEDAYARVSAANDKFLEQQQDLRDSWMSVAAIGVDALDAIIIQGDKASDVLIGLVKQLASAALQASLLGQGPLAGLFGTSGGGGLLGSLFKGLTGGGGFSGLYANGGTIPGGKWGIVGEAGAEVVSGPAQVTPIPKLLSAANGNSRGVTVVNHFHGVAGDNTIRRIAEEATARGVKNYAQQEQTISVERSLRQR